MKMAANRQRAGERGFTLVEIMISLAIGAIIVLGATSVFVSTVRSFTIQNGLSDANETGRYAMQYLARHIRMAGYRDNQWERGALPGAIAFSNGTSDTITVTYQSRLGCNLVPSAVVTEIDNVFDVAGGALRCNGRTIIDGVEELQVFLGEDTDGDNIVNRYVDAGTAGIDMDDVLTVSLNLLVSTDSDRVTTAATALAFNFWNTAAVDDGRLRREYSLTVGLRNLR
jgi:type IV pilus assembly protein PilW